MTVYLESRVSMHITVNKHSQPIHANSRTAHTNIHKNIQKTQLFASSTLVDDSMAAQKQERYVNKLKGEAAKNNEVGERNEW